MTGTWRAVYAWFAAGVEYRHHRRATPAERFRLTYGHDPDNAAEAIAVLLAIVRPALGRVMRDLSRAFDSAADQLDPATTRTTETVKDNNQWMTPSS